MNLRNIIGNLRLLAKYLQNTQVIVILLCAYFYMEKFCFFCQIYLSLVKIIYLLCLCMFINFSLKMSLLFNEDLLLAKKTVHFWKFFNSCQHSCIHTSLRQYMRKMPYSLACNFSKSEQSSGEKLVLQIRDCILEICAQLDVCFHN